MAKLLKLRRGTTTQHGSFTGAEGEVTIDTTKDTAVVHDGSQAGGRPLAREDLTNVSSSTIAGRLNNDSIAPSKIGSGTLPSDVTIADANIAGNLTIATGDINNDAVTFGKIQNISAGRMLGNTTGGSGDMAEMTAANVRTFINVEDGATADQSNAEIRAAVEAASDSNVFTDADHSKLNGIESSATADQTAAEIRTLVESASDSNVFTDADHSKLNGIEASATADQSNAEIRAAVEAASDSNVFTDADHSKLNGIEASATADQTNAEIASALSDQRPSMKGATFTDDSTSTPIVNIKTDDGSPWGLRIGNDGYSSDANVGLMIHEANNGDVYQKLAGNSAYENLYIQQSDGSTTNTAIHIDTNRAVHLSYQGSTKLSTTNTGVSVTGDMTASGNVTAYSDARLKTDIHTINDALSICGKLRGVSYKWIKDGKASIGVIAQEVEEVLPELVLTQQVLDPTGEKEVKSVDYGKIVGVLINAINELKEEVEELKNAKITG
jgi:hypothetical protein